MKNLKDILKSNIWIFILLFSIPAVWALVVPGYFGASDDMHIAWLYEFGRSIQAGKIPPRFVPDLSYGFGYPLFNFVFPLPFFIGWLFNLTGLTLVGSVKLLFLLTIPLSMFFMYRLLREFIDKYLALAGSVLYVFTPYRATDIYIRGAIGEVVSFVFLPLIILSVLRIVKGEKIWIGLGAISLVGLITSHNIMAYMFIPFVIILVIIILYKRNISGSPIWSILKMFAYGLLASIFFWLPAISESRIMKYDTVFNYYDHFPTLKQLLLPHFGYGASVPGPEDGMSFDVGTVSLLAVIMGIIYGLIKWKYLKNIQKILFIWSVGIFLAGMFMMNYRSIMIWEYIPLIKYFQFPWRFLTITTFASPLLLVVLKGFKYRRALALAIIVFGISLNAYKFKPQDFLGRGDEYYLNRYIPVPTASREYVSTSEEYLRLPASTYERPLKNYPIAGLEENMGVLDVMTINSFDSDISIYTPNDTKLNYYKYNFPGWTAILDGKKTEIISGKPFGHITVRIPEGKHDLTIRFEETGFRLFLDIISLFSIIYLFIYIFKNKNENGFTKKQ